MRLHQLSDEIREKMAQPAHRAAYDVYQLLYNNRAVFAEKIDKADLGVILADLQSLSESHPTRYHTDLYRRETEQVMNRLGFFLDRIF